MSTAEWFADLGKAAEDLGYGIKEVGPSTITLIARQTDAEVTIDSYRISGILLRSLLVPIPHRSGGGYTPAFEKLVR